MPTSRPEYGKCPKCDKVEKLKGKAGSRVMQAHLWRPKANGPQEECPGKNQPPKPGSER